MCILALCILSLLQSSTRTVGQFDKLHNAEYENNELGTAVATAWILIWSSLINPLLWPPLFHFPKACATTCAAVGPIAGVQVDSTFFSVMSAFYPAV